jgi:ABC-2 type transport system ATP-binding protein
MQPLQIGDLVKSFGARRALDSVSLELREREILGLLGPNGAGKSTLVRAIMGRVSPQSGIVQIFGRSAPAGDTGSRREVGVVPQEIALYPLLTIRENLGVFGRYYGLEGAALEESIDKALQWAGLTDRKADVTKTLSGGMKRRLNIAAGVLHNPRIILLDEPTVGVDPQSRERIYEMIESLRERGVSIIYTTHYMEEAERLCDRIAIIDHGRIIAGGTQEELVSQTIGSAREIVLDCGTAPGEAAAAALVARGASIDGTRITIRTEKPAETMVEILAVAAKNALPIRDLAMKRPTLENVFLHLTGRELRE